jgi:uncharacterized protein YecT (DUF1311 family)
MDFRINTTAVAAIALLACTCAAFAQTPTADALRALDAELNRAYQATLQAASGEGARSDVQVAQRRWVQGRNNLCELSARDAAAADWPANLQGVKAQCVARVTRERISALMLGRPSVPAAMRGFSDHDKLVPISEYTFPLGHTSGKWYAEFEVNRDVYLGKDDVDVQVGIDNVDAFVAVTGVDRTMPADSKVEVIGLAVDLDKRELFWRGSDGLGNKAAQPLAVSTKPFALKVRMNTNLQFVISRGHLRVNHGQRPFNFAMPAGYKPWYDPSESDEPSRWLQPPWERTEGLERQDIARGYWNWLYDREPAQNPTLDRTGELCNFHQGAKYWYLAGGAEADRIERRCAVPYGMPVVVPVMAILLQFAKPQMCEDNVKLAELAPFTLQNTFLEIDGKRFDRLQDYSAKWSACTPFEAAGKRTSDQAIWLGLWVPLRPLPRGEHVISFGGRFNALDLDRRVTYRINVQ